MSKKGDIVEGKIDRIEFPNKGIMITDDGDRIVVKNAIPFSRIRARINKKKHGNLEAALLEVISQGENECPKLCEHYGKCGGCLYQTVSYEEELRIKDYQIHSLLDGVLKNQNCDFEGIIGSPQFSEYRNKMEFTFGDSYKDGPLALGMHKRGSFYDIETVSECKIVDEDYRKVLISTLEYFGKREVPYFHRMRHTGFLRHLLVRRSEDSGELLVALVTSTQEPFGDEELIKGYVDKLLSLTLSGSISGIIHVLNDSLADAVIADSVKILYGQDVIKEKLLGLEFNITPFSFFQTNSKGAEVLYSKVREYAKSLNIENGSIFDLYSGTGTITQIMGQMFNDVTGVEIVEEAVEAAGINAKLNGLHNCKFIAGDVLKVLDDLTQKPDLIILDPPRDGVHPKALPKLLSYDCEHFIYVSCKPTSLVRDLPFFIEAGYEVKKVCPIDQFPRTGNVEVVALLSKCNQKQISH